MAKNLVIVESPAKAKTISRFLGTNYKVLASMGHVRDLPKSQMGLDIKNDFEPNYIISNEKKAIIKQLKDELKKADILWIATDEDREGEAIGWHLLEALDVDKKKKEIHRIVFHEITEGAIKDSLKHPRDINEDLVGAQQARRVLDRLVGYELSPLLWKKVRYGLSAGRVQSVAVRLIVEREREILAFKPEEYWNINAVFKKRDSAAKTFEAELLKYKGKNIVVKNEAESKKVLSDVDGAEYQVTKVDPKEVKKNPAPPFITSTLQQEASRKLGFPVKKTMMIAQQLYEGVDIGTGQQGLISYMRTDSVNLSQVALEGIKNLVEKKYGKEYVMSAPREFKKAKGAQEAHEAIRPVDINLEPENLSKYLNKDQFRLYELIWKRTLACQMAQAILDKVSVDVSPFKGGQNLEYIFRATGQTVKFPGFMEVYMEGHDNEEDTDNEHAQMGEKFLPKLSEGEKVDLNKLIDTQHFTKPPARYTEASLVKKLESEGIGRPSTYAPTIGTIVTRGYVEKVEKTLRPTDVAMVVTDMLVKNFSQIVDYKFTAEMESNLDKVEEGEVKWVPMIREFYTPFHENILVKDKELKKEDITNEASDEVCEKCGSKMVIKLGRFGKFLSCSNYPECKNARPLKGNDAPGADGEPGSGQQANSEEVEKLKEKFKDKKCEKCGKLMEVKVGRYGPFLGCSAYPECKNIMPIVVFTGVKCPKCKNGQFVERHTKKGGKIFWGCNKFPKCKNATWNKPEGNCKKCDGLLVKDKEGVIYCTDCAGDKGKVKEEKLTAKKELKKSEKIVAKKTTKKVSKKIKKEE